MILSKDGFENETLIELYLNGKKFLDLNDNWKNILEVMFKKSLDKTTKISCEKKGGQNKSDLIISNNNTSFSVSVKKGSGNSVHQEPLEEFIDFLKDSYEINEQISNDLRYFIWGDGTLDGRGKSDRLSAPAYKKKTQNQLIDLKTFLKNIKKI